VGSSRYFIVHGRVSCPFCVKAIGLLETKNVGYIFSPVSGPLLTETKNRWHQQTVPIVVERDLHNAKHQVLIGGFTELELYLQDIDNNDEEQT